VSFHIDFSQAECIGPDARRSDRLLGNQERLAHGVDGDGERARTLLQVQRPVAPIRRREPLTRSQHGGEVGNCDCAASPCGDTGERSACGWQRDPRERTADLSYRRHIHRNPRSVDRDRNKRPHNAILHERG
jgi:hypothetical protein